MREVGIGASANAHKWERARAADAERRPRDGRIADDERHCGGFRQLQHSSSGGRKFRKFPPAINRTIAAGVGR